MLDITDNDVKITERTVGKSSAIIKQMCPIKLDRKNEYTLIKSCH